MQTIKLFFVLLFCCCISTIKVNAQCTGCTITASPGGNYNLNSGDVLCITSSLGNLGLNVNGGKICVASGVTWTQTSGFNTASGFVINVYGSMVVGPSANIGFNGSTTFNVFQGGSLEVQSNGFNSNNQLTVNNEGNVSFTNTGSTVFQGTFNNRPTGTLTATMQPGSSDVFKFANGSIVTNEGIMTFTNLENEETQLFDNAAGATVTIGRYFYNHGNMFNYGKVETLCGPFGTAACEFIVGNKGPGKEFVNACCAVFNSNVTVKGGAKNNGSWVIKSGYNLDLQFVISGTNGALLVEGGNSQISCGGGYRGTNMTFYDANTPGNDFDSKCINVPSDAVYTVSNPPNTCCGVSPVTCTTPSAPTLSVTDNICPATTGSINVTTACGAGTRIEYSTDNGSTWSATAPTYGSSPITVVARCVTNSDATCFSPNSAAVTTAPVTCPPPVTCTTPSAPALSVTNNICPATTGTINVTTACGAGTRIEYSTDNGSTWSATAPTYGSSPITVVARCVTNSDATCFSPNSAAVTTAPVTCPPPPPAAPCSITITQQTQSVCNNNGTIRRAQDDYFTVSINATAISGGAQYEVVNLANTDGTGGNPLGFAAYGTAVTVGSSGNLIANNTAFTLTVRDLKNNACFKTITLNPVPPCSSNATEPPNGPCGAVPCAPIKAVKNGQN